MDNLTKKIFRTKRRNARSFLALGREFYVAVRAERSGYEIDYFTTLTLTP